MIINPEIKVDSSIPKQIESVAQKQPEAMAILAPNRAPLTYSNLCDRIHDVVTKLNSIGIGRNDRVAIVLPNSPEMAVSFLAVASAATCAPLNPNYRGPEFEFYLSDLDAKALIIQAGMDSPAREIAQGRNIPILELSPILDSPAGSFTLTGGEPNNPGNGGCAESEDIALILHTSGTTSRPKMVPLTHQNLCTSAANIRQTLALTENDRCLNIMPLFHIHGLIGALLSSISAGASVVCTPGFDAPKFFNLLEEFKPTWYSAVPTMHQAILARSEGNKEIIANSSIRFIRSSSASLPPQMMADLEQVFNAPVIEAYGMTEASHQMASNPLPPQVRKPGSVGMAAGPEIAIMDEDGNLLPSGNTGEVVIRGGNVTKGYENNPQANEGAFTNGWFRTGDLGYLDGDNYLFLKGRIKEIINRGGEKISPREIDEILLDHPTVAQALAFAIPHSQLGEDIAAAVVLRDNSSVTARELQEFVAARVADFKVPARVIFWDEIPKGPTGKLQRIGLAQQLGITSNESAVAFTEFTPASTDIEKELARIWSEVLGVEQVGISDNFFQLGGDSILIAQVINRVRQTLQIELFFLDFFETPTILGIAQIIKSQEREKQNQTLPSIEPISRASKLPLSYTQESFWFLDQLKPGSPAYHRPGAIIINGSINLKILEESLKEILRRHESLRTNFVTINGEPVPVIHPTATLTIPQIDLSTFTKSEQESEIKRLGREDTQAAFNLSEGSLLRVKYFRLSEQEHLLLLTFHHIIFDGWSMGVLLSELASIYEAFSKEQKSPLPELTIQYQDFAHWQRQWLTDEVLETQINYWKQQLAGVPPLLELQTHRSRPAIPTFRGDLYELVLPQSLSQSLKALSQEEGVTLFMTLLASFSILLHRYSNQEDIVIGTPVAGRNRVETEQLIGVLINTLLIRIYIANNPSFRRLLNQVKKVALDAYAHQELPITKLVEALQPERNLSYQMLFQVMFQFTNSVNQVVGQDFRMEEMELDNGVSVLDLSLDILDTSAGFCCRFKYNTDLFDAVTIERMAEDFQNLLEAIVANPEESIASLPLLTEVAETSRTSGSSKSETNLNRQQFSCYLIGNESLLIPCAEILMKGGHQILGIISTGTSISQWATSQSIPHIQPKENLISFLSKQPFDYLFSIYNLSIIPEEVLKLPRRYAINCHDALLPKYGGVNAPSWAIFHQEKTHGITWHQMVNVVDGGDILKQITIDIDPDETVFSLNRKCYEVIIHSFAQLVDDIATGRVVITQQNLEERSYFLMRQKPSPGCLLSWHKSADELDALVRALDFGSHLNLLGMPKLAIGKEFIIIPKIQVLENLSESAPGTITAINDNSLIIATASSDILLNYLITIEGQKLSIPEFVARFNLKIGEQFKDIDIERSQRLENWESLLFKHEKFWVKRLATLNPIAIPYRNRERLSPSSARQVKSADWLIPDEVKTFLAQRQGEGNLGNFLVAAFAGYLSRISQTCCFDLGLRQGEIQNQLTQLEGFFATDVPCRININYQQSFESVFQAVNQEIKLVKHHQTYPRDILLRYPKLKGLRESGFLPQFLVNIEQVKNLEEYNTRLDNALTLVIPESGTKCYWVYDSEIFDGDTIGRMGGEFTTFVQSIVTNPTLSLAEINLLSDDERHQILVEWNNNQIDYPQNLSIHQLFELQVAKTPDAVALVFKNQEISYRELENRANQLAHYLQKLGVKPEVLVGICVERSLEMIVGLLGILKAGGAYVPLDPNYPTERLTYMVEDAQISLLLTQDKFQQQFSNPEVRQICLDRDWSIISQEIIENPVSEVRTENLAYVIYTSGSTGKPKGVMINHQSLVNFTQAAIDEYRITQCDRVLQFASISFDAAAEEIYPCLTSGGTLVLRTDEMLNSIGTFLKACQDKKLTVLDLPTAYWQQMVSELTTTNLVLPDYLRLVIIGGERVLPESVKIWQESVGNYPQLMNTYGPTEGTVVATIYPIKTEIAIKKEVPIGRAIANVQTYILDQNLQPLPIGIPGELHIGGTGLARGYFNRPELTAEKFIPNPFEKSKVTLQKSKLDRLYKTGDLARYLPDGNIEFIGRIDNQVKIRGFRIELGEIEAVLIQHPDIQETVVIAREDIPGDKRLVAYIVSQKQTAPNLDELRRFLKEKLPDYMVPNAFVILEVLPLTPNGKLDRRAL
ncbi:amino acid adenylation domain-containing protein, partial [Symplocastrum sp. BBK-W-15]|nr:amino acid adenylation domain-containing protein [Limnofasciculus baicalensis BBK-W-15]